MDIEIEISFICDPLSHWKCDAHEQLVRLEQ